MDRTEAERSFAALMFSDEERTEAERAHAEAGQRRLADLESRLAEVGCDLFGFPLEEPQ